LIKGACHGVDMLRLFRWLVTIDAGIVHFQWSPLPVIDRWTIGLLRRRAPVVLTWHDSKPYQGESWLMGQGHASLLQTFNAIIVHTEQAQGRVAAMGINPSLIHRIPHGLLGVGGNPAALPAPRSYRDRDRLVLLQFGKIKPYKGVDLLLEALTLVPNNLRERLDVRIIGKPYMDTAEFEHFIQANGLAHCVTVRFEFVGEAEEERLFAEADAIVLPYRDIDASGVAMSAIARGVPILATAIAGFRELFEEEDGARLVPPGDAVELARRNRLNARAACFCRGEGGAPPFPAGTKSPASISPFTKRLMPVGSRSAAKMARPLLQSAGHDD
jgi:glycosyltransferase involved in cell wall biosynthesis